MRVNTVQYVSICSCIINFGVDTRFCATNVVLSIVIQCSVTNDLASLTQLLQVACLLFMHLLCSCFISLFAFATFPSSCAAQVRVFPVLFRQIQYFRVRHCFLLCCIIRTVGHFPFSMTCSFAILFLKSKWMEDEGRETKC
jgi:hypothetical protein